ncbi:MAG: tyrosine-type recombinase/integrase [bacterium]|nr:tyrosine-type recombinase/integrase [bacterium]
MVDKYLQYLKVIKKYSVDTINSYKCDIKEFIAFISVNYQDITNDDVRLYLSALYDRGLTKKTIARKLSSLRGYYNYLLKERIVKYNYFDEIKNPKYEKCLPTFFRIDEIDKILDTIDVTTVLGKRNYLIIEMLYSTGLRISELVNIKLSDINYDDLSIKVLGKRSKQRYVFYGSYCEKALSNYLDVRGMLNKYNSDYLFLNKMGGNITTRGVRKVFDKILVNSCIELKATVHTLRHTFATHLLNNGMDLMSVKELLGHESLNTTSIYTHVTDEHMMEVYYRTHPRN